MRPPASRGQLLLTVLGLPSGACAAGVENVASLVSTPAPRGALEGSRLQRRSHARGSDSRGQGRGRQRGAVPGRLTVPPTLRCARTACPPAVGPTFSTATTDGEWGARGPCLTDGEWGVLVLPG